MFHLVYLALKATVLTTDNPCKPFTSGKQLQDWGKERQLIVLYQLLTIGQVINPLILIRLKISKKNELYLGARFSFTQFPTSIT